MLKEAFQSVLHDVEYEATVKAVQILKKSKLSLADMGVSSEESWGLNARIMLGGRNRCWDRLVLSLKDLPEKDGLFVLKALVTSLEQQSFDVCAVLMDKVFSLPWCERAIQACPDFFRTDKQQSSTVYSGTSYEFKAHNAFQVLAYRQFDEGLSYDRVRSIIQSLKTIGATDTPSPDFNEKALHAAAGRHGKDVFRAFLDEFPCDMEARDKADCTPLHVASRTEFHENVRLLIERGADPKPLANDDLSPLDLALFRDQVENAVTLISTNAYDDEEISSLARSYYRHEDFLSAIAASRKAHRLLSAEMSQGHVNIKPL